jgi:hypothetical protein
MASFEIADFTGGDWGRIGPDKAAKNQFSATNMLVSRTGEMYVRPGVRLTNPTGLGNGVVWSVGTLPLDPSSLWFGQGTAVRYFLPSSAAVAVSTASSSITGTPTAVYVDENGTTVYLCTSTENGYSFNGSAITQLTSMPDAQAIALYGERLVVVPTSAPNTIRYSAAADFTSWPVANTITVGDTDPITALFAQRGHLAILKRDSSFYVLTGVPGVNDTLRPVYRFNGPGNQRSAGRTRSDDRVWFAPNYSQHVAAFDGTAVTMFDNITPPLHSSVTSRTVVPLVDDDQSGAAFVVPANPGEGAANEVWVKYRNAWTKHTFGVAIGQHVARCFHDFPQNGDATIADLRYGTKLVFCDGGGAGATPNFWSWQPFMDRPGLEADPFTFSAERAGDASAAQVSGTVEFPYVTDEQGRELLVRKVTIHFRAWNTGGSSTNNITATVRSLREFDGSYTDSAALSWTEAGSLASTAGSLRRKDLYFGDQGRGSAFQLRLSALRGVAIRRIVFTYDVLPTR